MVMEFCGCGCCDGDGLGNGGLILLQLREGDLFSNMFSGKTLLVKGVVSKTIFYENVFFQHNFPFFSHFLNLS